MPYSEAKFLHLHSIQACNLKSSVVCEDFSGLKRLFRSHYEPEFARDFYTTLCSLS